MNVQYKLSEAQLHDTSTPRVMLEPMPNIGVPDQLAVLLRADKNLKPESAMQLTEIFRLAY